MNHSEENDKKQMTNKIQNPNKNTQTKVFGHLVLWILILFVICFLFFVISPL